MFFFYFYVHKPYLNYSHSFRLPWLDFVLGLPVIIYLLLSLRCLSTPRFSGFLQNMLLRGLETFAYTVSSVTRIGSRYTTNLSMIKAVSTF